MRSINSLIGAFEDSFYLKDSDRLSELRVLGLGSSQVLSLLGWAYTKLPLCLLYLICEERQIHIHAWVGTKTHPKTRHRSSFMIGLGSPP